MSLRLQEGSAGALQLYIIPQLEPKRSQLATFLLKPLCLHELVDRSVVAPVIDKPGYVLSC